MFGRVGKNSNIFSQTSTSFCNIISRQRLYKLVHYFNSATDQQRYNSMKAELDQKQSSLSVEMQRLTSQIEELRKQKPEVLRYVKILSPANHFEIKPLLEKLKTLAAIKAFLGKARKGYTVAFGGLCWR